VRRNYVWIVAIQGAAFTGKLLVHPAPPDSLEALLRRADVGPIPGEWVLAVGALYVTALAIIATWSEITDRRKWTEATSAGGDMG